MTPGECTEGETEWIVVRVAFESGIMGGLRIVFANHTHGTLTIGLTMHDNLETHDSAELGSVA